MAYQSLYRRYRPQRFGDVLGQDHISATLRNALRTSTVAHAYLFSGPRGCGKTTSARILAKALNCTDLQDGEPCGACESCHMVANGVSLDINELDAASNNGVDAMRDLVSRAALGTAGRRKVYIVDEVHMLSTAASNALLKTLEEPPDHVVFVLATTDPQKVLPTIRSRTQHFEFRLFPLPTLLELVRGVAADAGIDLDDATLEAVARMGNGSARDALSALDQVAAAGGIDEGFDISELTNALGEHNAVAVLTGVERAIERGRDIRQLTRDLIEGLREIFLLHMGMARPGGDPGLLAKVGPAAATRALELLGEALVAMRDALDPRIILETTLVRLVRADLDTSPAALVQRLEQIERTLASGSVSAPSPTTAPAPPVTSAAAPVPAATSSDTPDAAAPVQAPVPTSVAAVALAPRVELPGLPSLPGSSGPASPAPIARRGGVADAARAVLGTVPNPKPQGVSGAVSAEVLARRVASPEAAPVDTMAESAALRPPRAHSGHPSADTDGPVGVPSRRAATLEVSDLLGVGREDVFELLERRAKVMLSAGRFVRVSDDQVEFGLPNTMHRQRCEEWVPALVDATSAALGRAIAVVLVVDAAASPGPLPYEDDADPTPMPGARRLAAVPPLPEETFEAEGDIDITQLADATDVAAPSTLDHLTSAFPGAEIVEDIRR